MVKSLGDLLKGSTMFLLKGFDNGFGAFGYFKIDSEFLVKKYYYKLIDTLGRWELQAPVKVKTNKNNIRKMRSIMFLWWTSHS